MNKFQNPPKISRNEALAIFSTGNSHQICHALISICFYDEDWKWCQTQCLHFLESSDATINGLAATCLGHIARIHRKIDLDLVKPILIKHLCNSQISVRIQDALDDIETFIK